MKGGDIAILYALKALASAGALDDTTVIVALTGDEESALGGHATSLAPVSLTWQRKAMSPSASRRGSMDEDGRQYATVARRSSSGWKLVVEGRQAHSSGIFSERAGSGAIFEASRILNAFPRGAARGAVPDFQCRRHPRRHGRFPRRRDEPRFRLRKIQRHSPVGHRHRWCSHVDGRAAPGHAEADAGDRRPPTSRRPEPRSPSRTATPPCRPRRGNLKLLELLNQINRDLGVPLMEPFDPRPPGSRRHLLRGPPRRLRPGGSGRLRERRAQPGRGDRPDTAGPGYQAHRAVDLPIDAVAGELSSGRPESTWTQLQGG